MGLTYEDWCVTFCSGIVGHADSTRDRLMSVSRNRSQNVIAYLQFLSLSAYVSRLKRYYNFGSMFFVTSVTHERQRILVLHADLLTTAFGEACQGKTVKLTAWAIMPDHFHIVLDVGNADLSRVLKSIKETFSFRYRARLGVKSGRIWQHRFWDHVIRDQNDLNKHLDYIHYNPVKHGLVRSPGEYDLTSFAAFVKDGFYAADWGEKDEPQFDGVFGDL